MIFHTGAMFVKPDFRGGAMVAKLMKANLIKKPGDVFAGLVVRGNVNVDLTIVEVTEDKKLSVRVSGLREDASTIRRLREEAGLRALLRDGAAVAERRTGPRNNQGYDGDYDIRLYSITCACANIVFVRVGEQVSSILPYFKSTTCSTVCQYVYVCL